MFQRLFGPHETRGDRWKARFIWLFVIIPAFAAWVAIGRAFYRLFNPIDSLIHGNPFFVEGLCFTVLLFAMGFSILYLLLTARAIQGRGHIRETTIERVVERKEEPPKLNYQVVTHPENPEDFSTVRREERTPDRFIQESEKRLRYMNPEDKNRELNLILKRHKYNTRVIKWAWNYKNELKNAPPLSKGETIEF